MDTPISRGEHEEFVRRMEAENKRLADEDNRQNHRLEELEASVRKIYEVNTNIERLAASMESMAKEQEAQGQRLATLESRDGDNWRTVVKCAITSIVTALIVFALAKAGIG